MATHVNPNDPSALSSGRYSEQRTPQYIGGSVDPSTGNIIPGNKQDEASGAKAQLDSETPPPAAPTTALAKVNAPNPFETAAVNAGVTALGGAAGKALGDVFSKNKGASGSNPLDTNVGGGVNNTGAGSSSGNNGSSAGGAGGDLFASSQPSTPSSAPSAGPPLDLSAPSGGGLDSIFASSNSGGGSSGGPSSSSSGGGDTVSSGGGGGSGFGASFDAGTVICTELHRLGLLDDATYAADGRYGAYLQATHPHILAGYLAWAPAAVRLMRRSPRFSRFVAALALPWAAVMANRCTSRRQRLIGTIVFCVGFPICGAIGALVVAKSQPIAA